VTTTYGTLSAVAGFPVDVRLVRRAVSTPAASGFVTARTLRANVSRQSNQPQTRVWRLTFGPVIDTLLTAWRAAKGAALPLTWTPPAPDDSAPIPVRFVADTLRVSYGPVPGIAYAEVELEEVP
jgi:hypothetical protein